LRGSEFTTKAAASQRESAYFVRRLCVVGLGPGATCARVLVQEVFRAEVQAERRRAHSADPAGSRSKNTARERTCHPEPRGKTRGCGRAAHRSLAVHRRYLIVVPRPLSAAPLVVRCRYLIVMPRLLSAAPRRCRNRRRTTRQMCSGAE
jgi:hypothetical protein